MGDLYDNVNGLWTTVPPITREEATRAVKRIRRHFKILQGRRVRTCWVSLGGKRLDKGWPRLVHDLSHWLGEQRFPRERSHGPHHAAIEHEMTQWVLAQGWLDGKLKPKPQVKKPVDRAAHARAMLARWETKLKRTETMLKKWRRKVRYYERTAIAAA
jgi:hypothetical protein